jgi:ABC-type phosphate transport system substrate-binding protein
VAVAPLPASAATYVAVSGSGSSWSAVALDQWQQDLRPSGLVINYNPDGSAAGRGDYMANQDDFAGSDPPFRNGHDQLGGTGAENPTQGYSYIPDTAGGTAFMYHIEVAGHLITNLRLSGLTLMKIFTGAITNWDDKAITKDYGTQLPNLPITQVIRSLRSGGTFFLTEAGPRVPVGWSSAAKVKAGGISHHAGRPSLSAVPRRQVREWVNIATYIRPATATAPGYDNTHALNSHYPVVKLLEAR